MPTSMEKWQSAVQPPAVVEFFRGLFDGAGVRVTDTGEAFTGRHAGDRIEFSDGIDETAVDFTVEIESRQVDLLLQYVGDGALDERERFRIMAVLATPATRSALSKPVIKSRMLRSILYRIGRAESLMHVVLAAPPGERDIGHTIAYVDGQFLVVPGLQGRVEHVYRLDVDDAAEYQRRMLAARKAKKLSSWIAFARWYGTLRKRVVTATPSGSSRQGGVTPSGGNS